LDEKQLHPYETKTQLLVTLASPQISFPWDDATGRLQTGCKRGPLWQLPAADKLIATGRASSG